MSSKQQAELKVEIERSKAALAELEKKSVAAINSPSLAPYGNKSNSDEARLLQSFGASDVMELIQKNTSAPQYRHIDANDRAKVVAMKRMVDCARLHSQYYHGEGVERREMAEGESTPCRTLFSNKTAKKFDLTGRFKAFGTAVVGQGAEFVDLAVSENFIEEYELEFKVANLFETITMPTKVFQIPLESGYTTATLIAEGATATSTNYTTDKVDLSAIKWVNYSIVPEELDEDSVTPFLARARDNSIKACARARETAILNGDITGTHMDNDTTAADDARKAWSGLRKLAIANSMTVDFAGPVTEASLLNMLKQAGRFGINPAQCAWIVSPSSYAALRGLPSVVTIDKMGNAATILSGTLANIFGIPVIVSQYVRQDLAATGVNTVGGPNTKSVVYLVNHTRFMLGQRRPIRVIAQKDMRAEFDRMQVAAYERLDFKGAIQSSIERSSVLGINVTV